MIANDPYLQQFVNKFTSQSAKAFTQDRKDERDDFEDYETNRKKKK
jgi:hypothetical protein